MKKWYVFDEADCINEYHFDQSGQAMDEAVRLQSSGDFDGVHIACLTEEQFRAYCTHGDLSKALKIKG